VTDRLEEPGDAVAAFGGTDEHRANQPLAHVAREVVKHLIARRLDVGQQLFHQAVVIVGELFEHFVARLDLAMALAIGDGHDLALGVLAVNVRPLQRQIDGANRDARFPNGDLPQDERHGRRRLEQLQGLADAGVGLVDLVEKQHAGDLAGLERAHGDLQRGDFAHVGFAHDDGQITADQRGVGIMGIFDGAGAINEGVAIAEVGGVGDIGFHAHGVGASLGGAIADRIASRHGAGGTDGPGSLQDRFQKRRFARRERSHQSDTTGPGVSAGRGSIGLWVHGRVLPGGPQGCRSRWRSRGRPSWHRHPEQGRSNRSFGRFRRFQRGGPKAASHEAQRSGRRGAWSCRKGHGPKAC
jgi:hypothetical protein